MLNPLLSPVKPLLWNLIQGFFHVMAGNSHVLSNIAWGCHEADSPSCAMHVLACLYEKKNMGLLVSLFPLTVCFYKNHHLFLRVNIFQEIKLNLSRHIVPNTRLAS